MRRIRNAGGQHDHLDARGEIGNRDHIVIDHGGDAFGFVGGITGSGQGGQGQGLSKLGLDPSDPVLSNTRITRFRLRPGDETSCLTLYRLPFWHYTTPLQAKRGQERKEARWVLLGTFLYAD